MSGQIHQPEILTEILKRLPAKFVIQLRCVSKSWYSLISNSSFISTHTKYTTTATSSSTTKFLLRHYSLTQKKEMYTFHDTNNSFTNQLQTLVFPFQSYSQYFDIIGSCDGLICLSDTYRINFHTIILWNPSIRKSITLPLPCISFDQIYMFVLGFGFDEKRNKYKVVRIVYQIKDNGTKIDVLPQVEVYELGMDAWRSIHVNFVPNYVISELSSQIFMNGFVHWIGYKHNTNESDCEFRDLSIVLFDMGNEVFKEMKLPTSVCGLSVLDLSIFKSSKKLLSLVQYNRHSHSQWIQYGSCCIWVMKEYGKVETWSRLFRIDLEGGVGKALGLIGSNVEMLLVAISNGELVSYEIQNQKMGYFEIKGIVNSFYLDTYIETLVLLDGDDGILKKKSELNQLQK